MPSNTSTLKAQYLYGPWLDFALLGGGSLGLLLLIRAVAATMTSGLVWSAAATLFLANIVNNPHFACSYQIFYKDIRQKLFSPSYPASLRLRYFVIGLVLPPLLVIAFAALVLYKRADLLGMAVNLMFFLVGWHYVKQGYGMAMVDAALKRAYYSAEQKKLLLRNAYVIWMLAWLLANYLTKNLAPTYFGIPYVAVPVPRSALLAVATAALYTTGCVARMTWQLRASGRVVPWNGLLAYGVSLYAWLLVRDPIILLWVPLFHSLQYLAVVWKFQANRITARPNRGVSPRLRMAGFLVLSFGLGYYMFWGLPSWLDQHVGYDKSLFGSALFLYCFWIFINIHHYFVDTVMWRKGNPDVARYLFASPLSTPALVASDPGR